MGVNSTIAAEFIAIYELGRLKPIVARLAFSTSIILSACLFATACRGPSHPDQKKYEYLYIGGVFQAPYRSFQKA
jgi:hypothetical protein